MFNVLTLLPIVVIHYELCMGSWEVNFSDKINLTFFKLDKISNTVKKSDNQAKNLVKSAKVALLV